MKSRHSKVSEECIEYVFELGSSEIARETYKLITNLTSLTLNFEPRLTENLRKIIFDVKLDNKSVRVKIPPELMDLDYGGPGNILLTGVLIMNHIPGNVALSLTEINIPDNLTGKMGPKIGVEGVRRILTIKSPLIGLMFQTPFIGSPHTYASLFYDAAIGGVDIGIDSPVILNQSFAPIDHRTSQIADYIDRVKSETGRRVLFGINITGASAKTLKLLDLAIENDANAVSLDITATGFETLKTVTKKANGKIPVIAIGPESMNLQSGYHKLSSNVLAMMARLAGADIYVAASNTRSSFKGGFKGVFKTLTSNYLKCKKTFPATPPSIFPSQVEEFVGMFEENVILTCYNSIMEHPNGVKSGASAMRHALDSILRGESLSEASKLNEDLRIALEKWKNLS